MFTRVRFTNVLYKRIAIKTDSAQDTHYRAKEEESHTEDMLKTEWARETELECFILYIIQNNTGEKKGTQF